VELEVGKQPGASLGDPITLSDLALSVRTKIRACIRVFGREFCASLTTSWLRTETAALRLDLQTRGLQLVGLPSASDVDILIKIKIWKWSYTIRIGVTGYVNDHLRGMTLMLLDASTIRLPIPMLGRTYVVNALGLGSEPNALSVSVDGGWS